MTPLIPHFDLLATAPGGVARLRELILTLAVQGKLVPQEAGDEPASVLLQRIRAEKDRLIAAGKFKRDMLQLEITEENIPFKLPHGWEWFRFGEILDFQGGSQPPKSNFSSEPLPGYVQLIQIRDLGDKPQPIYVPKNLVSKFCTNRDIMIGRYGASVGKVFWGKEGAYNVALVKIIDASNAFDKKFLFQLLRSPIGQGLFSGISRSAQDGFNKNDIEGKLIPCAPLKEQSRIVTRVEELMRLCDALEQQRQLETAQHAQLLNTLLGTLTDCTSPDELAAHWQRVSDHFDLLLDRPEAVDALEQTILQLAVRGLLVPQDPADEPASVLLQRIRAEKDRLIAAGKIKRDKSILPLDKSAWPNQLPAGWDLARIDSIAAVQGGIQKTPLRRPVRIHFPYLRVANVQRDSIQVEEMERYELTADELANWRLEIGDILIVEGNGSEHEIGRCAVWSGEIADCVFQNHLIRVKCMDQECIEFLRLFLNSPDGKAEMKRLAITTSGLFNLSVGKIRNFAVPVPPLAEQTRIVARVTQLRDLCADLRQRLTARQTTQRHLAEALVEV